MTQITLPLPLVVDLPDRSPAVVLTGSPTTMPPHSRDAATTHPISQPDGPGEAIGTFRLVGYSLAAIVDCGAFGCENGLGEFPIDKMEVMRQDCDLTLGGVRQRHGIVYTDCGYSTWKDPPDQPPIGLFLGQEGEFVFSQKSGYKHDRIDDCTHRFPHCRTCRCSDCRPMEWKQRQCGDDVIVERVIRFDG